MATNLDVSRATLISEEALLFENQRSCSCSSFRVAKYRLYSAVSVVKRPSITKLIVISHQSLDHHPKAAEAGSAPLSRLG